jgi:hypothetical protein
MSRDENLHRLFTAMFGLTVAAGTVYAAKKVHDHHAVAAGDEVTEPAGSEPATSKGSKRSAPVRAEPTGTTHGRGSSEKPTPSEPNDPPTRRRASGTKEPKAYTGDTSLRTTGVRPRRRKGKPPASS